MKNKRLKALIGVGALALTLSFTNTVDAASKYATTTANLNFRTGPSTSNKVISTIKKGSKVEVISKNGSWTKIKYNNKEGYSSSEYLKEDSSSSNNNSGSTQGTVTASKLNIRSGPSTSNSVVTKAKKGEKVTILESKSGWYKVKLSNGKIGWASAEYISKTNSNPTPPPVITPEGSKTGTVTASRLNIRSGPSTSNSVVTKAKKGEKVTILESKSGWYKVKLSNGKTGWASSEYIKVEGTNPEPPPVVTPPVESEKPTPPPVEPEKPIYTTNKVETNYDLSFDEYARLQNQKNSRYSIDDYKKYMDINQSNNALQFLRIDKYRDIKVDSINAKLVGKGVLEGQGQNIANAAKSKNIDPVYFIAQSILETGHGKSTLAKGVTITEIADESKPLYKVDEAGNQILDDKGNPILIGYEMIPLSKPTTVYNLYGIGAKDNLPEFTNRALILGTTYAYNKGWTNVESAINGAASFVADNYIHSSKYNQNTVYEFTFNPSKQNMWHQYATDVAYADKVGNLMKQFKDVYVGGEFTFDMPVYSTKSRYSISDIDLNQVDDTHLSIGDITNY